MSDPIRIEVTLEEWKHQSNELMRRHSLGEVDIYIMHNDKIAASICQKTYVSSVTEQEIDEWIEELLNES